MSGAMWSEIIHRSKKIIDGMKITVPSREKAKNKVIFNYVCDKVLIFIYVKNY